MKNKFYEFLSYLKDKFVPQKATNPEPLSFEIYPYNKERNFDPSTKSFLHEFHKYTTDQLEYDGIRSKQFYIADSNIFSDYINEVKTNPNTSFKSYIHDTIKSGYDPKYINCIKLSRADSCGHEVLASRILNYYQIPTAYYTKATTFNEYDNTYHDHILSVDFMTQGDTIELFTSFPFIDHRYIDSILSKYEYMVNNFYKENKKLSPSSEDINNQLTEDNKMFVKSFLVRVCLMNDTDMKPYNIAAITNKEKGTITPSPNFDLEFCFNEPIIKNETIINDDTHLRLQNLKMNLKYISENYPEILDEFIKESEELLYPSNGQEDKLDNILQIARKNGEPTNILKKYLYDNYATITGTLNILKMEKEENENETNN